MRVDTLSTHALELGDAQPVWFAHDIRAIGDCLRARSTHARISRVIDFDFDVGQSASNRPLFVAGDFELREIAHVGIVFVQLERVPDSKR